MSMLVEVVTVPVNAVDRALAFSTDPDGNRWTLQERGARNPGV